MNKQNYKLVQGMTSGRDVSPEGNISETDVNLMMMRTAVRFY